MTLSLPADAEVFVDDISELHQPGCYALRLSRPDDLADKWDSEFDTRPEYWDALNAAYGVVYVGAAADVLRRLEEHRDGEVRKAALLRVCEIESLRNIWWFDSAEKAFERESGLAIMLQNERPDLYVHSR